MRVYVLSAAKVTLYVESVAWNWDKEPVRTARVFSVSCSLPVLII